MKSIRLPPYSLAFALLLSACGKPPPPQGGPPADYAVRAVVAEVRPEEVKDEIRLVGSLLARDAVQMASETEGRVAEIAFTEGASVKQGQVLLRLDAETPSLQLKEAEARQQLAEAEFQRGEELLASQTISQQEFDRLKANHLQAQAALALARKSLADTEIIAPFDGVVGARMVSVGAYISRGMPVTSLVRLDPLDAEFNVPERYFAGLRTGQRIEMSTVAHPDEVFPGEVQFIAPEVDLSTRTVRVKAEVPNTDQRLRPGMFGQVSLTIRVLPEALVIPEAALITSAGHTIVVVMNAEGRAEFRPVTAGMRLPGRVLIADGLRPGERIVVEGHQKMGPGIGIEIAPGSEAYGVTPPPPAAAGGTPPG